jgi:methylated-DNA-[protein]-cysteine S-methyltransferase
MQRSYFTVMPSPIGELTLSGDGRALTGVYMELHKRRPPLPVGAVRDDSALAAARAQLEEYFEGERVEFDLPLEAGGTPFQRDVWAALREIPYGETISYGELARRIGRPDASRAVGLANGRNPISIVVPCHRVIGASGTLTGYGGGLDRKRFLLEHERGPRLFRMTA